jgi:hypothetical protein
LKHAAHCVRGEAVRTIHVTDDDGDVLKPAVIAARIGRHGPALRRQEFGQVDDFVSQTHANNAHAHAEEAFEVLDITPEYLHIGNLFKAQHLRIEIHGTIHVGNDNGHSADPFDGGRSLRLRGLCAVDGRQG